MTKMLRVKSVIPANQTLMQVRLSSAQLRRELGARNLERAQGIVHESTDGAVPSVLYQEVESP
jgi:hypothetical protein